MILPLLMTIVLSEFASMVEADAVLKDELDLSQTVRIADQGRHIVIHDACEKDGLIYLAGGATSTSSFGGMDAVIYRYDKTTLIDTWQIGGLHEDRFLSIHCGETLWLSGYSRSPDFLDDSSIRNFGKAFILELNEQGQERNRYVAKYGFESRWVNLDRQGEYVIAVGQAQRVTESDFYYVEFKEGHFKETLQSYSGYDALTGVEITDQVTIVGYSNSTELGTTGIRGIIGHINEYTANYQSVPTSSETRFHGIHEGMIYGVMNDQGVLYDLKQKKIQVMESFSEVQGFIPEPIGPTKGKLLIEDQSFEGSFVAKVSEMYIIQQSKVLHEVVLFIPSRLERMNGEYFLNQQILPEPVMVEVENSIVTELHWQIETDDFTLITRVVTHPKDVFCNVDSTIYFHPVTIICNEPFTLNHQETTNGSMVSDPGMYELTIKDQVISFEIKEVMAPVVLLQEVEPRVVITPRTNRMWMIPASWVGLFWLKKLQE